MKAFFIDLDGTLLNDRKQITPATREALLRVKAAGHEIIITTGRSYPYVKVLNEKIDNVCRYTISSTGSIIYDLHEQKTLSSTPIPDKALNALFRIKHPDIAWLLHCAEGLYSTGNIDDQKGTNIPFTEPLDKFIKTKTVGETTMASYNFDLIKNVESDVLKIPGIFITHRHRALTDPSAPRNGIAFYDIIPTGVSKGTGVKALRNLLGIPKADCIAIGDDINDLPMFAECGIKVAANNAVAQIKKIADHITTDDNNHDGVAKFLDSFS